MFIALSLERTLFSAWSVPVLGAVVTVLVDAQLVSEISKNIVTVKGIKRRASLFSSVTHRLILRL